MNNIELNLLCLHLGPKPLFLEFLAQAVTDSWGHMVQITEY